MLKFHNYDIVFQEIPDEVTLAVNITGCPCHCPGCHSPHLWEDSGTELDEAMLRRIYEDYAGENQRLFRVKEEALEDITYRFWRSKEF